MIKTIQSIDDPYNLLNDRSIDEISNRVNFHIIDSYLEVRGS